ncbi:MAG: serine hydrolase [Rubrivivax sp.]|nr:serine hydrolase [Rubrivivax sp.]
MGWIKRLAAVAILATLAGLQACTLTKTVVHNFADLDDHRIFANREVAGPAQVSPLRGLRQEPWFLAGLAVPDETGTEPGKTWKLDDYLAHTRTAAFVVLHEDRVVLERYGRGYDRHSLLNSFSIAKAVMSTLVGIALAEGRIASLDTTVASVCPEFAGKPYGAATVRELLTMTSGVADAPSLLPGRAEVYYGDDLRDLALRAQALHDPAIQAIEATPATQAHPWRYSETDVQVLGFVLERAVGMPVSQYLAARLWQPLGMESKALWALDREGGSEKTFCCLSARARDFARFGQLMRDGGRVNGRQIVPAAWAARSVLPGIEALDRHTHQHLWWAPHGDAVHPGPRGDFYAYGHNGQYLYVNPAARLVIVKFSETNRQDPVPMFRAIADAVMAPQHLAEIDRLDAPLLAAR